MTTNSSDQNYDIYNKGCNLCTKRLLNYKKYLYCSSCNYFSHSKCNGLSKTEGEIIIANKERHNLWICKSCSKSTATGADALDNVCTVCTNLLGKRYTICTSCNNTVHTRCNHGSLGCTSCRDLIFPLETDLFDDCTTKSENLLFNPYEPSLINNMNGNADFGTDNCELMETLSQNL